MRRARFRPTKCVLGYIIHNWTTSLLVAIAFFSISFTIGTFVGAWGGAAVIYPFTVTLRVLRKAKRQGKIDHIPLSPILMPPLVWLFIIPAITYVNFRFLPYMTVGYWLGMAIALVRIISNINNPVNEQEAIENSRRYFKKERGSVRGGRTERLAGR